VTKPGFRTHSKSLPAKQARKTSAEHIIPRSLLGPKPTEEAEKWSPILDVHRQCESTKQEVDSWNKILHDLHTKPTSDWPDFGHVRGTGVKPEIRFDSFAQLPVPVLSGIGPLLNGVWQWIRGLHAVLYERFLPVTTRHFVLPPVPAFGGKLKGPTLNDTERMSSLTRDVLKLALSRDKWDGITAWGGGLKYRCIWWKQIATSTPPVGMLLDTGFSWVARMVRKCSG